MVHRKIFCVVNIMYTAYKLRRNVEVGSHSLRDRVLLLVSKKRNCYYDMWEPGCNEFKHENLKMEYIDGNVYLYNMNLFKKIGTFKTIKDFKKWIAIEYFTELL
jgi:hypothetical protein